MRFKDIQQGIVFYLLLPLMYLLSILPFWFLYGISDVLYFFIYHVFGYRKKVVLKNLELSFPEKSVEERNKIMVEYYHHMCDIIVESLKMLTISKEELKKRIVFVGAKRLQDLADVHQSMICVTAHYNNWEWAVPSCRLYVKNLDVNAVYRPLSNSYFDAIIRKSRGRLGAKPIPMATILRHLIKTRDVVAATALVADQTPPPDQALWTTFLHQETPFFTGPEKIAKALNMPVVYIHIKKVKRGYYTMDTHDISINPKNEPDNTIMMNFVHILEQEIQSSPSYWLWSHRRWKHQRPASCQLLPR